MIPNAHLSNVIQLNNPESMSLVRTARLTASDILPLASSKIGPDYIANNKNVLIWGPKFSGKHIVPEVAEWQALSNHYSVLPVTPELLKLATSKKRGASELREQIATADLVTINYCDLQLDAPFFMAVLAVLARRNGKKSTLIVCHTPFKVLRACVDALVKQGAIRMDAVAILDTFYKNAYEIELKSSF